MDHFAYRGDALFAEDMPLSEIAERFGTPAYVYSRATIERHYRVMSEALGERRHLICYAVKANSNLGVLSVLARLGAGFDIVSVGELERVLRAGGEAGKVIFSGVGKRADEMARALEAGIRCFNVESEAELELLNEVASGMGQRAPVSLRVNPDVDARTHPYISTGLKENKFGIDITVAEAVYRRAADMPGIEVTGVDCHIGSQLTATSPFTDALERVLALVDRLAGAGIQLRHIDVGGGLGIRYHEEQPPSPADYAAALGHQLDDRPELEILLEPGRVIVGNAGVLLMRVLYLKQQGGRDYAIVDAAMNDLLRPALYDAWQEIVPVNTREGTPRPWDIVGPVCESADFLGRERPLVLAPGDLLAVRSAGAYGFVMASSYNSRPRPPEILVDGEQAYEVRRRETLDELMTGESLPPA